MCPLLIGRQYFLLALNEFKQAKPGLLERPHSVSDLTKYAVTFPEMAVSASKLHSYTSYLDTLMALETDKENMINAGTSKDT